MPGLTVTEKKHWRDRIAARIEKAVERIRARHPALFDRVAREAHAQALASLGLAEAYAELEAIKAEEATLARRKKQAQTADGRDPAGRRRSTRSTDTFHVRYGSELALPHEVAEAIARRQAAHQEQLLADDPVGREIARLEAEKDPAGHGLAGDLAGPDQAALDQGRRAARRRADGPGTRGAGDRAGEGGLMSRRPPHRRRRPGRRPPNRYSGDMGRRDPPASLARDSASSIGRFCQAWEGPTRSTISTS